MSFGYFLLFLLVFFVGMVILGLVCKAVIEG